MGSMSKRPDRLEREIKKMFPYGYSTVNDIAISNRIKHLLRRERARLKRKVRGLKDIATHAAYRIALDDVLRMMEE